jgi:2-oxoglutarate dehydrogenase E2 component (dihydrolipoamide succinyltransferase)
VVARLEEGEGAAAAPASGAATPSAPSPAPATPAAAPAPATAPPPPAAAVPATPAAAASRPVGPLSPAVRHLIDEHALDAAAIPASGKGGRLTKGDVLAHLEKTPAPAAAPAAAPAPAGASPAPRPTTPVAPPAAAKEGEEVVPLSRLRKRIAERLVQAQHTAAILTTFNEVDMSAVMALRAAQKERFQKTHGIGLGFMSLFARACIAALADVPAVNAEIRGDDVVYKHFVNLGVAVGTERGLVVPVVKHAERMSFAEIEREIVRLAGLARDGKLAIDDLAGGTFTISNGGVYGSLLSTPILNPPQSGILGMHKIEKRPIVIDDQIVIRPMMYLALSYDHRLVDGEQAVTFLVRVKERLEDPSRLLLQV